MARLLEILTQGGLVTPSQARDAANLQVIYGDRIGTNLLASGALRETALARALGAVHRVPYAAGKDADSRPAFTRGIHRNVALAFHAVPARVDDERALVFMCDPHDANARAQLAAQLRRFIEPVIVCEARMRWLLHKFYMAPKPSRLVTLDDDERGRRRRIRPRAETRPPSVYATGDETTLPMGRPAPPRTASSSGAPLSSSGAPLSSSGAPLSSWPSFLGPPPSVAGSTEGFVFDDPTSPMILPPAPATWPSFLGPEPRDAFAEDEVDELLLVELEPVDEAPLITGVLVEPPRDTSPLSFDEAKALLAGAEDRDEIALIVLRSCRSLFSRAVLLTVQGRTAVGWDGVGDGVDAVKEIRLPLSSPSIFKLAHDSKAHFLGPLPKEKVNILFLKLTGAQIPKSALVVPVVVRGSVVNLLYCDNGKGQEVATDIGDMLVVAQHINRSYEHLLAR